MKPINIVYKVLLEGIILTALAYLFVMTFGPTLGWETSPTDTWQLFFLAYIVPRGIYLAWKGNQ